MTPSVITSDDFHNAENNNRPPKWANFRVAHTQGGQTKTEPSRTPSATATYVNIQLSACGGNNILQLRDVLDVW